MSIRNQAGARLIGVALAALAGCAGKPPVETIAAADTAIHQAMTAKAEEYAPDDMRRALDKASRSKQAMADEHYDRARRLAEEARADAEVAEAKARYADARRAMAEAQRSVDALRREARIRANPAEGESNAIHP